MLSASFFVYRPLSFTYDGGFLSAARIKSEVAQ